MRKKNYEIIPIVESEIVPDMSLELIKGGGYTTHCTRHECIGGYEEGKCAKRNNCGIFCWQCKENKEDDKTDFT